MHTTSQQETMQSKGDQPPPILTVTPDKTLAERRGSPAYSEAEVLYISNASDSTSEAISCSCSARLSSSLGMSMTSASTDISATVNASLVTHLQFIEAENNKLHQQLSQTGKAVSHRADNA